MIENDPVQTSWYINSTRSDLLLLIQMPDVVSPIPPEGDIKICDMIARTELQK